MAWSSYGARSILDHICRGDTGGTSFAQPALMYAGLHYADPTSAGLLTTEVSGGSYQRQVITFGAADALGEIANTNDILFALLPTLTPGLTHVSLWDAQTAGNMIWYDDVEQEDVDSGDNVRINVGNFIVRLPIVLT